MIKKLISFPYQLGHLLRESFFNLNCSLGFTKRIQLNKPVVSIGNISFGGTGKTPFCFELVKYFSSQGLKVGILSRGYKSKFEKSCAFFSSLSHSYSAKDIGDEPLMLANKFKEESRIRSYLLRVKKVYPFTIFISFEETNRLKVCFHESLVCLKVEEVIIIPNLC